MRIACQTWAVLTFICYWGTSLSAQGQAYITRPDFMQLDLDSQIKITQNLQDYTLKAELNLVLMYRHHNEKQSQNNFKSESWWSRFGQSFSAYAQDSEQANTSLTNYRCIYGGWPSITVIRNGTIRCLNPNRIDNSSRHIHQLRQRDTPADRELLTDISDAYNMYNSLALEVSQAPHIMAKLEGEGRRELKIDLVDSSDANARTCDPQKRGDIICNPTIFGKYPHDDGGFVPICVPGDARNQSYHTTYTCQQVVESLKENAPEKYQQMVTEQIRVITNPRDNWSDLYGFDEVKASRSFYHSLRSMYQMCMCSDTPSKERGTKNWDVNQEYAHRMFYSRTCVGTINQVETALSDIMPLTCNSSNAHILSESWLDFIYQAYDNLASEGQNWRDFSQLERSSDESFRFEEGYIKEMRDAAITARGGRSYCNIDMELEEAPIEEEPIAEGPIAEESIVQEPAPIYSCHIKSLEWQQVDSESAPEAEETNESAQALSGNWVIMEQVGEVQSKLDDFSNIELSTEEQNINTEDFTFHFSQLDEESSSISFKVTVGAQEATCQMEIPPKPEVTQQTVLAMGPETQVADSTCSLHLSAKQTAGKTRIEANLKEIKDGEVTQISPDDFSHYSLSYFSLTTSNSTSTSEEEMVSETSNSSEDSSLAVGSKLGDADKDSFIFELAGPAQETRVKAKLTGPNNCQTEQVFTLSKNASSSNTEQSRPSMQTIAPSFQAPAPPPSNRPPIMRIFRGNR